MPGGREDDARAFYEGVLGVAEVPKPPELASRGGCWFRSGQVELHLGIEEPFMPARKAHPAIVVDDLDAIRGRLDAAGADVADDVPLEGHSRIHTADPFGNRLELLQA
ncbi:MAG: VOC family protein [Actinomycetota bacterium]|nr:VOC family protein [Actinomycetota bacterium]